MTWSLSVVTLCSRRRYEGRDTPSSLSDENLHRSSVVDYCSDSAHCTIPCDTPRTIM